MKKVYANADELVGWHDLVAGEFGVCETLIEAIIGRGIFVSGNAGIIRRFC